MIKNLCLETTIATIFATVVFAIVKYLLSKSFELVNIVVFAAVFGVIYFLAQTYFSKKLKGRK